MKLRAKSDHRIREFGIDERNSHPYYIRDEYGITCHYKTLKEVADNWEDVSTEEVWYLGERIGNYSMSKKEAKEATEKMLAWKRLKDKGLKFNKWTIPEEPKTPHIKLLIEAEMDVPDSPYDLDLLFGGEE